MIRYRERHGFETFVCDECGLVGSGHPDRCRNCQCGASERRGVAGLLYALFHRRPSTDD